MSIQALQQTATAIPVPESSTVQRAAAAAELYVRRRRAEVMGFLDKQNPRATRRSAAAWAIGGSLAGGLLGFFGWLRSDMPFAAVFFIVPWMVVFCALGGWATEWQVADEAVEDAEPGAAPDPARDNGSGTP